MLTEKEKKYPVWLRAMILSHKKYMSDQKKLVESYQDLDIKLKQYRDHVISQLKEED